MYSQEDLQQTGKQLKRIIILLGAVLIAFLVISIVHWPIWSTILWA